MKQRLRPSRNLTLVGGNEAVTATARGTMEKTMKAKWLTLTLALAFAGGAAFAHGNKVHVKGTVEKIDGGSLQVRTPEGKTVAVKLLASGVLTCKEPPSIFSTVPLTCTLFPCAK